MFKTIMVPMTGFECDRMALETAFLAGRPFHAHLESLFIRPGPTQLVKQVAATDIPGSVKSNMFADLRREDEVKTQRARDAFHAFCKHWNLPIVEAPTTSQNVSVAWLEQFGDEIDDTIFEAHYHDLIVFGRAPDFTPLSPYTIGSIVLNCGCPVLLASNYVPENLVSTVAIAWKHTPQAARAITASMPLLEKASRIVVLAAIENGREKDCMESAERLVTQLHWHGLTAESHCVVSGERRIPDAIANTARDLGADLMVMGAYGHSRLRELAFGGFTWHVLSAAPLPVLMFH